jgi:transcriptional regulator of acetoin/glycerol metabolism
LFRGSLILNDTIAWTNRIARRFGYPDGLKGDQIPLTARILQTTDMYDALIMDRPYRQALLPERALSIKWAWPGNIRELQNVIERSMILCETEIFSIDENWLPQQVVPTAQSKQVELPRRLLMQEKNMIEAALMETRGRVSGPSGAAVKLGIPRSTLESKIRSLKINKNPYRTKPGT